MSWEGQAWWNIAWEEQAELSAGCWRALFFIACGLMNETRRIATKETRGKNGRQKSSSVPIYLPLQLSSATALPVFRKKCPPPLKSWFQSFAPFVFFFPFTEVPQSLSPNPSVLPTLLYLDTLLSASPFTGSYLCTTDTLISPGLVLLQRGVGCPSGITLIAVWEHRIGLLSTSPFLYFSLIILYSHFYPPACLNATYILFIFPFFPYQPFFLDIHSFPYLIQPYTLVLFWCKIPTVDVKNYTRGLKRRTLRQPSWR